MRRLLQIGSFLLLLVTFVAPLSECFERWDAPGISNDVEFAVFALILALCLVLLVSKLVSGLALLSRLVSIAYRGRHPEPSVGAHRTSLIAFFVPPLAFPPLKSDSEISRAADRNSTSDRPQACVPARTGTA